MEITVKDLKPNPYRNMDKYKIEDEKVLRLIQSIKQTGFWDNILARPKPNHTKLIDRLDGGDESVEHDILTGSNRWMYYGRKKDGDLVDPIFEIAYGHHRLEALKQVMPPDTIIDIPIKELDDSLMVQIMANENKKEWDMTTTVLNETVRVARDFLDAELEKYASWEMASKANCCLINLLGNDKRRYSQLRNDLIEKRNSEGVGQLTILKFLGGEPLWRQGQIQEALENLGEEDVTLAATEIFEKRSDSRNFRRGVRSINKQKKKGGEKKIPKEETEKIALNIKQRMKKSNGIPKISETKTTMETMIQQEIKDIDPADEYQAKMNDLNIELKQILEQLDRITSKISTFNGKLEREKIKTLKGVQSIFGANSLIDLFKNINQFSQYLGFTFNGLNIKEENNE